MRKLVFLAAVTLSLSFGAVATITVMTAHPTTCDLSAC